MATRCGGLGQRRPADDDVNSIVQSVKPEIEAKAGRSFSELKPVSYATQVVAGVNYFVKLTSPEGHFLHARIFRDLQSNVSVHSVQTDKTETDEITYF